MDVDDFISKLSLTYIAKIKHCSDELVGLRHKNRQMARNGKTDYDRLIVMSDIRVLEAKRLAYIQATADIESIQDQMGI